tara:strand:+ start:1406 stop:1591 length:186 start_codon:yes stop_codon:yes gene_type:complete
MSKAIYCPICNSTTKLNNSNLFRPFCSERCQLVDLGKWVDEKYSIVDIPSVDDEQTYTELH